MTTNTAAKKKLAVTTAVAAAVEAQLTELPTNPNVEVITLERAITRGDLTISTVSINKPLAGALRGLTLTKLLELDVNSVIKLIPRVSMPPLTENEVAAADAVDLMQFGTAVIGFFASADQKAKAATLAQ